MNEGESVAGGEGGGEGGGGGEGDGEGGGKELPPHNCTPTIISNNPVLTDKQSNYT